MLAEGWSWGGEGGNAERSGRGGGDGGLGWVGLGWVGLGWVGLGWVGLGWWGEKGMVCGCAGVRVGGRKWKWKWIRAELGGCGVLGSSGWVGGQVWSLGGDNILELCLLFQFHKIQNSFRLSDQMYFDRVSFFCL